MKTIIRFALFLGLVGGLFAEEGVLYQKDGITLSYCCDARGTYKVTTTPGNYETCKRYHLKATLTNNSANDIKLESWSEVSYFIVQEIDVSFDPKVTFSQGVLGRGQSITAETDFLLNPSYERPGTPSWTMSAYKVVSGAKAGPSTDMDNLLTQYETVLQRIKNGDSDAMSDFQKLNAKIMENSGSMTEDQMKRFSSIVQNAR